MVDCEVRDDNYYNKHSNSKCGITCRTVAVYSIQYPASVLKGLIPSVGCMVRAIIQ